MGVINVKRIVHCTRWMVRRNVERFEVVIVILNFWTFNNVKAHGCEKRFHALNSPSNWV